MRVTKRKDGRYCAQHDYRTFYGHSAAEVRAKIKQYDDEKAHQLHLSSVKTVREFTAEWLPLAKGGVSKAVYNQYCTRMDHLIAAVGDKPLAEVKPLEIAAVLKDKYGKCTTLGIKSVASLYKAMFDAAIENGYCTVNPCRSKTTPQGRQDGTHRAITEEERHLIETVPSRSQTIAMLMLYAGLRRGEAMAVDLDKDIVDGRLVLSRFLCGSGYSTGKNRFAARSIPIVPILEDYLKDKHGPALPTSDGQMYSTTQGIARAWSAYMRDLSKAAGHPVSIRCHDLRHSFVVWCVGKGVTLKTLVSWCGHSDERMIMRVYDHMTAEREQMDFDKLSCQNSCQTAQT